MKKKIIFFDTETNGFSPKDSVLSISAFKFDINMDTFELSNLEELNRYYYPVEYYNERAISVNGLTKEKVDYLRRGNLYPRHFKDDSTVSEFFYGVEHYVAHNMSFDSKFMSMELKTRLCTMKSNLSEVKATFSSGKLKWPTLTETAIHYGIEIQEERLHESDYDVELTIEVFRRMLKINKLRKVIIDFLVNDISSESDI